MSEQQPLPQQATAQALRNFIAGPALWTLYNPIAMPATAIFTGYALSIGIKEAQIAFLVGLSGLIGMWQAFSFHIGRRVTNKPRFLLTLGPVEITIASAAILMAFVPQQYRFMGIACCLVVAYLIGHTLSPMYSAWLSHVLPTEEQGPFIGKQMSATTIVAMVHLYLAGLWIDYTAESYAGFLAIFIVGWLAGIGGYVVLCRSNYPAVEAGPEDAAYGRSLGEPLHNSSFRRLCIYLVARLVPMQMGGAFTGVYMIKYLELPYSLIAIYTNMALFCMMIGYVGFGALAQRYGSKPLMQILGVPVIATPVMWALTTQENAGWLLPIIFVINGSAFSGIFVSTSNMLFKIAPKGKENSAYFGVFMAVAAIGAAAGAFIAGFLRDALATETVLWGLSFNSIQMIFLLSAGAFAVALITAALLKEDAAASPGYVLGQFRGNLLSLAYNSVVYMSAREDETRASAIRGLGRSRSPLAVERLLAALGHVSHEVRSEAALGIGDGKFEEAVDPLIAALEDEESDIRPEAAQALGKIGAEASIGPLLRALGDDDVRVRTAAVHALGHVHSSAATEALVEMLEGPFDLDLFPALVDAGARTNDLRIIEPALAGLKQVRTPVVRLQVINGICRLLGEKNHFYRIATANKLQRAALRAAMMTRIRRLLRTADLQGWERHPELMETVREAASALAGDREEEFAQQCGHLAMLIRCAEELPEVSERAAYAIETYLADAPAELLRSEGIVFLIVCLTSLARHLPRA
jgi:HEAT repeat protein/fucose permease